MAITINFPFTTSKEADDLVDNLAEPGSQLAIEGTLGEARRCGLEVLVSLRPDDETTIAIGPPTGDDAVPTLGQPATLLN